ncbi:MAG TPA: alpha/beta hydrolase [Jatrophihabitans sp.]|jgi:pimeloyl-ACP methyl ester carboxylesterase
MLMAVEGSQFSGRVHVRVDGPDDAPLLVLLHGFSGSLHWFDPLVERLRGTFRLIRVDLLGHGATGGAATDAPGQARMVQAVLETLDVDDVTAVGHSFGADVAVELAEQSARVSRLVVLAQAPDYSDAVLPRGNAIMTLPVMGAVLHRGAQRLAGPLAYLGGLRNPAGRELARRAVADFRALNTAMFRVILVDRRARMARRPLDVQLRDSGKPALVVLGGRDHFYGARSAARYDRAGAHVEILPESGHNPILDFPDETAELVRTFVAQGARIR